MYDSISSSRTQLANGFMSNSILSVAQQLQKNLIKSQLNWLLDIFGVDTTAASRIHTNNLDKRLFLFIGVSTKMWDIESQSTEATSHLGVVGNETEQKKKNTRIERQKRRQIKCQMCAFPFIIHMQYSPLLYYPTQPNKANEWDYDGCCRMWCRCYCLHNPILPLKWI